MPRIIPQSGVCARVQNKLKFPVIQLRLAKTVLPRKLKYILEQFSPRGI